MDVFERRRQLFCVDELRQRAKRMLVASMESPSLESDDKTPLDHGIWPLAAILFIFQFMLFETRETYTSII